MSVANEPEKIYISPRNENLNGLVLFESIGFCCDVVFANSNFELGSFYHPVLYSYPLCRTYFLYLFFDLSVKFIFTA
ncbi:hypothetical protein F9817_09925 [Vibrio sp. CAIM 722]|uniref:Uncharacterized protein n=1 Tax=Vibrio eleionomae TaxID=2653505 RepID=A0A7X4RU47_9VIBR|nr:hypothetical protein [Vibrio eleionomae]